MKKIPSKLNGYKRHEEINQEMSHVVWDSFKKDAFNKNWNDFLMKYSVGCNKWLSESEELTGILHQAFDNVMAEMQEYQAKSKSKCSLSHEDTTLNDLNLLDGGLMIQLSSRLYHAHDMNYYGEDDRSFRVY
ncbi:hypothetical protein Ahy_A02g007682 [Arachis hypogaea]|uniref:Protein FAR1-RELATED SEQUENCE n=1 Tax=Arachis hypogaea TaxID=3818 RepID=A0A445ECW0_ARAHY|nr:hypothetical protein Ahy_A02g007682 [Arachis hypogaea]